MKLLFYIHGLTGGGAERVMAMLMNHFVKIGHTVTAVYTSSIESPIYNLDHRIEEIYMQANSPKVDTGIFNKIYRRLWKYQHIRKIALKKAPDIAISFLTPLNNDVIMSLLFTRIPVIVSEHSNVTRKYKFSTHFSRTILYPFANAITVLTSRDYKLWEKKYKNVIHIPNPCDIKNNDNKINRDKIILAAGRIYQWKIKGFDNLIRCWNKIKDDFPEWRLQIAGTYDDSSINLLKKELCIKDFDRIDFLGFRKDIYTLMEKSEIFCLSSRIEGLPMVLIEAMNAGCCCVSFDCETGPNEIITNNVNGILVENQNIDKLEESLRMVMQDKILRKKISGRSIDGIKKFSIDNISNIWEDLFTKMTR